ncbi:MAG: energy transducer TonB [Deltaproteobacteria bacterium]|nr:energy transducer TonB [Deltaproteobacteria bacterium]
MRSSDFILPFLISTTVHVWALSSDILHRNAEVIFEKGVRAVTLNIVPSVASKASSVMPAVVGPAAKQSVSAQPSPGEVIIPEKAGLIQDVPLHPQKKQVHHPHHRIGIAAVNSKNNDGDCNEKGVTSPVVITGLSKPKYPRYSRINGEEGTVVFIVEVSANGRPGKIEVETSSGYRRLDCAAVKALEKAAFIPARLGGKAVASTKRIAFRFDLEECEN